MEVALGVASLVLLAGGTAALIRRSMEPRQAVSVVLIALVTGVVAFMVELVAHNRGMGSSYTWLVIGSMTLAGIVTAVAVIMRRL